MNNYPILYINLDNRPDRNKHIIKILSDNKLFGERVSAIKDTNGYIGCVSSHIKCLDIAIRKDYDAVIILEDDFIFTKDKDKLNTNIDYDVFLLGGTIYEKEIENDFYRVKKCSRTEGYIIKKHYYETLRSNFLEGLNKYKNEPIHENKLDIYWHKLQEKDRFYCNKFGLIGGQKPGYSDIVNGFITRAN